MCQEPRAIKEPWLAMSFSGVSSEQRTGVILSPVTPRVLYVSQTLFLAPDRECAYVLRVFPIFMTHTYGTHKDSFSLLAPRDEPACTLQGCGLGTLRVILRGDPGKAQRSCQGAVHSHSRMLRNCVLIHSPWFSSFPPRLLGGLLLLSKGPGWAGEAGARVLTCCSCRRGFRGGRNGSH